MKKIFFLSAFLISLLPAVAQQGADRLHMHLGYGTENNFGSTAFFGGIGWAREKGKKWVLGMQATRFTTALYNAYDEEDFDGEEQEYKAWFLTPAIGYKAIGNHASFFSALVAIGPSLKYFNYKIFRHGLIRYYADGRREPVGGTISWYEDRGINLSLFTGISFNFRLSERFKAGLFLDTYSNKIWIEHFMPGVKMELRMKNQEWRILFK